MQRKTKINVLLPFKMVGELERLSKAGKRSDFIEKAIRNRLDGEADYNIADADTKKLAALLFNRIQLQNDYKSTPLSLLLLEMIE
tara:strand:- start:749 stop:1003 length:255 start_codon:yes stop_codon:yes gene_type:complete